MNYFYRKLETFGFNTLEKVYVYSSMIVGAAAPIVVARYALIEPAMESQSWIGEVVA